MPTLPSSGTHWIEPAASGAAVVATPVKITETATPGLFEFTSAGTPAEIIWASDGQFEIVSEFTEAALVEAPAGVHTLTPGGTSTTVLVESPQDVYTITALGIKTGQIFGSAAGLYRIVSTSDRVRATLLRTSSGIVMY
jgi:hypothetical protein